ncbi:MAG: hypothetical protein LBV13_01155 [Methanomassiliicoccaceae archaeon]|nr:hypothetical protein [Methanomassiliicoccaceae archaeon]
MKDVRISMVQMSSVPGDPEHNLEKIKAFIRDAEGSDIICFPELSLTGYAMSAGYAVAADDALIKEISRTASENGIAAAFGFAEREGERMYISHGITGKDGTLSIYRKTHLGVSEKKHFTPGSRLTTIGTDKVRIGLQICAESHFPEVSACLRYRGAELILMPHAWPGDAGRRTDLWRRYLPARAYDNGVFVAACNSVVNDGGGGTMVLDPKGRTIGEDSSNRESMLTVILDGSMILRVPPEERKSMRDTDFFSSRRPELYSDVTRPMT